jgi:hypothetical protein
MKEIRLILMHSKRRTMINDELNRSGELIKITLNRNITKAMIKREGSDTRNVSSAKRTLKTTAKDSICKKRRVNRGGNHR